jgi:hypothetical protein
LFLWDPANLQLDGKMEKKKMVRHEVERSTLYSLTSCWWFPSCRSALWSLDILAQHRIVQWMDSCWSCSSDRHRSTPNRFLGRQPADKALSCKTLSCSCVHSFQSTHSHDMKLKLVNASRNRCKVSHAFTTLIKFPSCGLLRE